MLPWLTPESADEPLAHYAARLVAAIPIAKICYLVGISFGGVLALEAGRLRPLARVVLISSLASPAELPWPAGLARITGLHRLVSPQLLRFAPRVVQWFFGAKKATEHQLLQEIMRDTEPQVARWAIAQLVQWQGLGPQAVVRIHGTADCLLPVGAALSQHLLPGGHFIIVSQAPEISQILNRVAAEAAASSQVA